MLSFQEYASEELILELLIKERVKIALKNKLKNNPPKDTDAQMDNGDKLTISEEVRLLMPSRKMWKKPCLRERIKDESTKEKKSNKQILTRSIALTIKSHRKNPDAYPYLTRLDNFIQSIKDDIKSDRPLSFNSIRIFGKKKKINSDNITIYRPLCVFQSLRDKLLIALASNYLTMVFDPLLHEEIISYRPLRTYHGSEQPIITNRDNAIENLQKYRYQNKSNTMYVAECDIQKYFDTINHDVIRQCFRDFAQKIKANNPEFEYSGVERIVEAYLNSYSFFKNIIAENERFARNHQPRMYETPNKDLFIERGCYSEEEFINSQDKIGIPQGGALSGLMSNVVLSSIDSASILKEDDTKRFFCRYGDDIILIHTSKEKCRKLITDYCNLLTQNKLLFHDFISLSDERFRRPDGGIRPCLWDQKSRSPFLWGRDKDENESVDWIGFLGYEVRYTGEVRMRRSSLDDKFKYIKRQYKKIAKTKLAHRKDSKDIPDFRVIDTKVSAYIDRFATKGFSSALSLNRNKYVTTQALKLNQYASRHIYHLLYKIAKNNNIGKDMVNTWWQQAKDKNCINYLKTIKK